MAGFVKRVGLALLSVCPAVVWTLPQSQTSRSEEPCAQVSAAWAAQKASNATATPIVDGQLAFDCLNSVPLTEDDAVRLVRSIQPFLEFQTTTAYLRDPPADYPFPAFDLEGAFEELIDNIQGGQYSNEYEFQADLFATFNKGKDGHLRFFPDLLTAALVFRRGDLALVSVSMDGKAVPEIYTLSDIRLYNSDSSFSPSPVRLLNGQDAVGAVVDYSLLGALQDLDALYNIMFYSPAFNAAVNGDWQGYYGGSARFGYIWPGPSTNVTFENGTTAEYVTVARVVGNFSDISDGPSFYTKYCSGTRPVTEVATPPTPPSPSTPEPSAQPTGNLTAAPLPGYPVPVVTASDRSATGYYLPGTDVAVLGLITYAPAIPAEFQRAVEVFLRDAKAAGKTKLIVDVSANGGGLIFQGHDTFRQLFPQIQQDGFNRWRSTDLLQISGALYSAAIPDGFDPLTAANDTLVNIYESYQNYRFDLDVNNKSFASAQAKFATDTFQGDNFTQIHRWNFDDPLLTENITFGVGYNVTGYRSRTNFTQPFAAEDIVLLYDGFCGSTCTLFSEFLRVQAGVRSVTFGGRPGLNDDGAIPNIQNYGGVKGANNIGYNSLNAVARRSLSILGNPPNTTSAPIGPLSQGELDTLNANLDTYAFNRSTGTSLNVRDNILRDRLDDGLPAQFIIEPTDCRLFYTPLSIVDPQEQWRQAAEAVWGQGSCVAGSGSVQSPGQPLQRVLLTRDQYRRGLERGKVISMPDKEPVRSDMWEAIHGRPVPL